MAYGMTNDNSIKKMFFWLGEGDNGKSATMNLYKKVIGDFCCPDASKAILEKRGNSCLDTEKMILVNKRVATLSELRSDDKLDATFIKKVVGDDKDLFLRGSADSIQSQYKIICKFIIPSNEMPTIKEKDNALLSRLGCFNFCNTFPRSASKLSEIMSKKNDLFTHLCFLANKLTRTNFEFSMCDEMKTYTKIIKNQFDSVSGFFDAKIELTDSPTDFISGNELYIMYCNFCNSNRVEFITRDSFGKKLSKAPYNFNTKEKKRNYTKAKTAHYFFLKKKENDEQGEITENDDDYMEMMD